jgi:hypothetical protein
MLFHLLHERGELIATAHTEDQAADHARFLDLDLPSDWRAKLREQGSVTIGSDYQIRTEAQPIAPELVRILLEERKKQARMRLRLNQRVRAASVGRLHYQACPLGGEGTGLLFVKTSGECWCGAR